MSSSNIPTKKVTLASQTSVKKVKITKEVIYSFLLLFFILLIWELFARLGIFHPLILPAPSLILSATIEVLQSRNFTYHFGITLYETLAGFIIGCALAVVLGVIVSNSSLLYKILNPYIVVFQAVPKIALAPIFTTWFGFGPTAKVVMAVTICFFPTFVNTVVGFKSVDPEARLLFSSLGARKKDLFIKLYLPSALPYIFAGLKASLTFALIGAIVGEFIGANEGIGLLIETYTYQLQMPKVYALILILSVLGLALYLLIEWLDRRLIFWVDRKDEL